MIRNFTSVTLLSAILFLSGCTQTIVANRAYIREVKPPVSTQPLKDFPVNISAILDECHTISTGVAGPGSYTMERHCSNKGNVIIIAEGFAAHGYMPVKASDSHAPTITLDIKELNGFLEGTTGFFNVITFGILPLYHHEYYTATYKSPTDNVEVSKTVKIWSTSSWISLFLPNSGGLKDTEIERRAKQNLVREVLNEARL